MHVTANAFTIKLKPKTEKTEEQQELSDDENEFRNEMQISQKNDIFSTQLKHNLIKLMSNCAQLILNGSD
ncbi:CLUMA_CG007514, isoform A [Clunio marinus]|uniref:CLUMA_CG007514, isoform A n=1 Tax=Clunio marinus TaxID=568069 RepID=A0A1J1I319_9DIPT|nr:CLUMA_CG007514, isoform A [Clunio marinus]